jgi:hypothetical protein
MKTFADLSEHILKDIFKLKSHCLSAAENGSGGSCSSFPCKDWFNHIGKNKHNQ